MTTKMADAEDTPEVVTSPEVDQAEPATNDSKPTEEVTVTEEAEVAEEAAEGDTRVDEAGDQNNNNDEEAAAEETEAEPPVEQVTEATGVEETAEETTKEENAETGEEKVEEKVEEKEEEKVAENVEEKVEEAGGVEKIEEETTEAENVVEPDGGENAAEEVDQPVEAGEGKSPEEETTKEGDVAEGEDATDATDGEKVEGEDEEGKEDDKETESVKEKSTTGTPEEDKDSEGKVTENDVDDPVPQSDTFTEGERVESPVGIGEKLSREPTPIMEVDESLHTGEFIEPTTPERIASPEEEEDKSMYEEADEDVEETVFDRDILIERYHAAQVERERLQTYNFQLQHKLAEYYRKKKPDERQDYDVNVADQEQRYLKFIAQLHDLRRQEEHERENRELLIQELKERCQEKKEKVDQEREKFVEFRRQVAINAISNRTGKPIPPKDIEQYMTNAVRKESEVVSVRLENIKLKNKLKKKEVQLKSKEELAEGLHLIDFEQLKIENQTYNEKIEERNEELLKLRKKITSTVQVLTHLKEKLQFVSAENHIQKGKLRDVESLVSKKRDILSRTKKARDSLRIDNQKLRQNCGLRGNESLLRDFEEQKDHIGQLKQDLKCLKTKHAKLTLKCTQVRRKIEQAKSGRP